MEYILIFLPLLGSILSGFFGKYIGDRNSEIITCLFISISAILSLIIFKEVTFNGYENNLIIFKCPFIADTSHTFSSHCMYKSFLFSNNQFKIFKCPNFDAK